MTNEPLISVAEDAICWEEFRSKNGRRYQVGHLREYDLSGDARPEKELRKADFGIAVNWPVHSDKNWTDTDESIKKVGAITRYALYRTNGFWKYTLYFTNTEHYSYHFYDQTGDDYNVDTFRNGDHYVRYDSVQPNIAYISGD